MKSSFPSLKFVKKYFICTQCSGKIQITGKKLLCKKCESEIILPTKRSVALTGNVSLGEKIFDFPALYRLKIDLLNRLNKDTINLNDIIHGKTVLDIGCGSYLTRYSPSAPKLLLGTDKSIKALYTIQKLYPMAFFFASSADRLPLANKSVDVTLMLSVLHHLTPAEWWEALKEVQRVTRDSVIILDHQINKSFIPALMQKTYWKIIDGGHVYLKRKEWEGALRSFTVKKYQRFGALFGQMCLYHLKVK